LHDLHSKNINELKAKTAVLPHPHFKTKNTCKNNKSHKNNTIITKLNKGWQELTVREFLLAGARCVPGVNFMKLFQPKFTNKT
jgi:hypothetical protein